MKIGWNNFPLLKNCDKNVLIDPKRTIAADEWELFLNDILKELHLYKGKRMQISYITSAVHEKLWDTNRFAAERHLLQQVPECFGYLILPEKLKPLEVAETTHLDLDDFYYDSVLFSFVNQETHDMNTFGRVENKAMLDEDEKEEYLQSRWLTILPVQNGKIKYCHRDSVASVDDEFGSVHGSKKWDAYANMLDYVFSFLIYFNFIQPEQKVISAMDNGKIYHLHMYEEKYFNETLNDIVIVE